MPVCAVGGLGTCRAYFGGMSIYISLLVAVIGVLVYALAANAKTQEMGRIAYFAGLLAFLLAIPHAKLGF